MGADVVIASDILTAFRTGEDKLCAAVGAYFVVGGKGVAAIRAQVHAAVGAYFVVLTDRLATVAAERGPLDSRLLFRLFLFVHNALIQFGAAVRADCGVGGDLLVTHGAIETELGPALGTDCIVRIHPGSTLGTMDLFVFVGLLIIDPICCHGFILGSNHCILNLEIADRFYVALPSLTCRERRESIGNGAASAVNLRIIKEKGCHLRGQPRLGSSIFVSPT
jgi:hypothetical protein